MMELKKRENKKEKRKRKLFYTIFMQLFKCHFIELHSAVLYMTILSTVAHQAALRFSSFSVALWSILEISHCDK